MALQKKIELSNGITLENAYIRVDAVMGSKFGMSFNVDTYMSETAYKNKKGYMERKAYSFVPSVDEDSKNFIAQAYKYLKTLDEFSDAKDV